LNENRKSAKKQILNKIENRFSSEKINERLENGSEDTRIPTEQDIFLKL
jgi:hypothetical protein